MSRATTANTAWLTAPADDALPPEAAIGAIAKKVGFTPDVARLLAITPSRPQPNLECHQLGRIAVTEG